MDTSNLNISNQDLNNSVKNSDVCDEEIFIFNSSENSVTPDRNRCNNKLTLSDNRLTVDEDVGETIGSNLDWRAKSIKESPVWCMDFCNDLIILGCSDGRLEFWEASSGKLMASICINISKYQLLIRGLGRLICID